VFVLLVFVVGLYRNAMIVSRLLYYPCVFLLTWSNLDYFNIGWY
jgi:hypothetical protein